MRRGSMAVLPLTLAFGCSAAPVKPQPQPRPTASHVTETKPPPPPSPRKLSGQAVVLALRTPTVIPGADWVWILPEAKLATLAPADPAGRRMILGPNFFAGPKGAFIGLDTAGELDLAADGRVSHLGKFDSVAFDAEGRSALVWDRGRWVLFARSGERLRGDYLAAARPLLLPTGLLVEHVSPRSTRVVLPPSDVKVKVPLRCDDVFPYAQRLVCFDPYDVEKLSISVVSLTTGEALGRFADPGEKVARPPFSVRADGLAVAWAGEKVEVVELAPGKPKPRAHTLFRRAVPNQSYGAAGRVAFTGDGKYLCVEESTETRVLSTSASEWKNAAPVVKTAASKSSREVCLFAPRGADPSGPNAPSGRSEWDALRVKVPVREGFEPAARRVGLTARSDSENVSFDRTTGVLVEQKAEDEGDKRRWAMQAVVFEVATGAVRQVIPLGALVVPRWSGADLPMASLSPSGSTLQVCSARIFRDGCHMFDTRSGAPSTDKPWPPLGSTRNELNTWSGKWPDVHVSDVMGALTVARVGERGVNKWSDEGSYLSVEMDAGNGAAVHLNVPDATARIARDVVAVAGGGMLAVAEQGSVVLWSVQPLEMRALLVPAEGGVAALYGDGSIEAFGAARGALGCQQGEVILPVEQCGDVFAAEGTLAAMVAAAARSAGH
jgi:hypothetical protein